MTKTDEHIPEGYRLQVVHLHRGNTSGNQLKKYGRTNAKYVTIAKIFGKDWYNPVSVGIASCSQKDNPNRQLGREIAVGRAMKQLGVQA